MRAETPTLTRHGPWRSPRHPACAYFGTGDSIRYTRPMTKGVVVDLNVLQRPDFQGLGQHVRAGRARIVVSETAIAELCRNHPAGSERWVWRAMRALRPLRDSVDFVRGMNVLVRFEHGAGCPLRPLVDAEGTRWFRELLSNLHVRRGAALDDFRARIEEYGNGVRAVRYQHDLNKRLTLDGIDGWANALGRQIPDFLHRFRTRDRGLLREAVAKAYALYGWGWALDAGLHAPDVRQLPEVRSAIATTMLISNASKLLWLWDDGAAGRAPEKFSNDRADEQYIATALLGDFLLWSEDRRTNRLLDLCREGLETFRQLESYPTREEALGTVDLGRGPTAPQAGPELPM